MVVREVTRLLEPTEILNMEALFYGLKYVFGTYILLALPSPFYVYLPYICQIPRALITL